MTIKVTYNVTDVYMTQSVSPVYINVSYSDGGSGAAVWGSITGTLSNQTDLQNAVNAKFDDPTGTTSQYLRGDGSLETFPAIPSGTVSSVGLTMPSAFSVANSPVTSSGTLAVTATGDTTQYIAGDGSLVAFPITGQAGTLVREVRNNSGATITKGTVVYINGALGNRPTIAKAIATSDPTSAQTFGLVQANINNNSNGYIVAFGDLDGLDTSAYTEGAQLYLSATVLGGYTITKQYAPNHLVYIGVVTRSHVNQGRIEVRIQNGYEMDELHDVAAQTPSNNDGLFYNTTNSLWENKSIATALGYTPVPTTRTITINGVSYDLSADRTYTIAAGISGSGTSGQVTYWSGSSAVSGSNNLFWDNANGRLGIGTNAPAYPLNVVYELGVSTTGFVTRLRNGGQFGDFIVLSSGQTSDPNRYFSLETSSSAVTFRTASDAGDFIFAPKATSKLRIYGTSGNVLIQNGGTFSDGGQRLQVIGDTLLRGSGATSATTALTVQNSSSTNLLRLNNIGELILGATLSPRILFDFALDYGGDFTSRAAGTEALSFGFNTSGRLIYFFDRVTSSYIGGINPTGGFYIGQSTTRYGLNVQPANASITALTVKSNGRINMAHLPTSATGLVAGDLWNDAGTIKIV